MVESATTERHTQILPPGSESSFRFPTDQEATDALCAALGWDTDRMRDGRHARRINHEVQVLQYFLRSARATGEIEGKIHQAALMAALYPDIENTPDAHRKKSSRMRWARDLQSAGLLELVGSQSTKILTWRLLTDWRRYAALSRGYSSVGVATAEPSCEARRRPENRPQRRERRVRPHCRRVGNNNGSVGRLVADPHPQKPAQVLDQWGLTDPLRGPSTSGFHAHEGPGGIDPPGPGPQAAAAAGGDAKKRRAWWVAVEAERLYRNRFGPPPDGPLIRFVPLVEAVARFDRAAARLAELHGRQRPFGWPEPGLSFLSQLIGDEASAFEVYTQRPRRRPRHVGYFIRPLLAEARRNEKRCRALRRQAMRGPASRPRPPRGSGARHT